MKIFEFNSPDYEPEISIVCVTYNAEIFIDDLVASIFQQDIINRCELIISDDASVDGTVSLLQESLIRSPCYAKLITRDENVGALSNWLQALNSARGRLIAWVDGDDYYLSPLKLSNDLNVFDACDSCSLVFSPSQKMRAGSKGSAVRNVYESWDASKIDLPWVLRKGGGFYPSSSVVFKSSVLLNLPEWFMVTHCTGDLPLAAAAVLKGGRICYRKGVDTAYRIHDQSITNSKHSFFVTFRRGVRNKIKNCEFYRLLFVDAFISKELYLELIAKEQYVFYSKLLDLGAYKYCIKKSLGTLSMKYLIRLYAKLTFVLAKNMHKALSESFSRTNGSAF